ncbi:ATP-dependent DNA helicase [Aeromicrobium sp. Leaf350]|uniref:ATP-dependent DNA helicase n=1 Tax=Aeromicrobium sp. Leaf350 TaxID=2876565 RepID=UPI001E2CA68F|nr:ATP-dependent DNA helicase [Aeromicrobium sp. Leaf350]
MTGPTVSAVRDVRHLCDVLGIPFSPEQRAAITAPREGTYAIIAGAGSGKTAVMAARVVWLVGHVGVDPERVLGLTFTSKAAGELAGRVRESLARVPDLEHGDLHGGGEPTVSTYHAFAGRLIAEHGLRLGLEPDLEVLTDARRHQLVVRMLRSVDEPLQHVSTSLPHLVGDVLALDGQLSEHLVDPADLRELDRAVVLEMQSQPKRLKMHAEIAATALRRTELSHLVERYRAAKADAGVMDFSDQMAWGTRLAQLPEVAAELGERFDVVLLDEYQDTSVAQRDLLASLFQGRVTAVGDPAQGIYGWRGAATGNLEGFIEQFTPDGVVRQEPFSLAVSRRCGHRIIDLAGHVAREFYAESDVVRPLEAAPENPPGEVTVALHSTVADEVTAVADAVRAAGLRHDPPVWNEIGVLVRTKNENAEIVQALRARDVPVEIVGLTGLLAQPEVLDVLAVLEVLDDMTANPSMVRLLAGPRWRVGDRDLALLGRRARRLSETFRTGDDPDAGDLDAVLKAELDRATAGVDPTEIVSLAEAVADPGPAAFSAEARERMAEVAALLARLRRHVHEPLTDLVHRVVRELQLDIELDVAGIGTDNLALLHEAVARYAVADAHASLGGLMSYLTAEREHADGLDVSAPSEANSVKVLTVHKAKGLEYDEVFVPFLADGVFPSRKARSRWTSTASALPTALRGDADTLTDLDDFTTAGEKEFKLATARESYLEEVRLAYVALTRAKGHLHLSGHRWGRTQKKARPVSPFLADAVVWLSEHGGEPLVWAPEPSVDDANPLVDDIAFAWPHPVVGMESRRAFAEEVRAAMQADAPVPVHAAHAELAEELELVLAQAERAESTTVEVTLPATLSATQTMALLADEQGFVRDLARPVPRRPSAAARFGTTFHAWVEDHFAPFAQPPLLDPSDLPGSAAEVADDVELAELKAAFEAGPFAARTPHSIEEGFSIQLGAQRLIGRIDAVFPIVLPDGTEGFEIVDWKTNRSKSADPLQLAVYRLAWAEQNDVDPARVLGSFHYVRLGETVTYDDLPGRSELERLLAGEA